MSEIKDAYIGRWYGLGFLQLAELAARAYDKKAVCLYSSRSKINFPIGNGELPMAVDTEPRVVSHREVRENREAFEWLKAAHADKEYRTELHWMHQELVAGEPQWLEM